VSAAAAPAAEAVQTSEPLLGLRGVKAYYGSIIALKGVAKCELGVARGKKLHDKRQTEKQRYDNVMHELQMIGQRDLLCGLHVHVELPDPDDRVDIMMRMLPYLPLFIALATSSPFWRARPTGLKGYRLAAYDELPRTGVPELFRTPAEYDSYIAALVKAGVMEDSSYVWWAIRPSMKHPTLELRAPDSCTLVEDSVAIAALYRTLARRLTRNPWQNWDLTAVTRAIVVENKWRAQRYGVHGTFVDISGNGAISLGDALGALFYVGTHVGDAGTPNANGVTYDSTKDGDWFDESTGNMGADGSIAGPAGSVTGPAGSMK